ncbi:MAG TPA: hypothetical protein VKC61_12590 [Pyrinomonadaceae bacterium]|nr:hypothetical protein [Pyrinomonadaceae bacterium]
MKLLLFLILCAAALGVSVGCSSSQGVTTQAGSVSNAGGKDSSSTPAPENAFPVIHVFVALCDNINQGIVPVSASLGNGDNPATNLYWGAAFGVKTFFGKSKGWELVLEKQNPSPAILDRLIFKRKGADVFMVADAYRGKEISQAIWDFLEASSGKPGEQLSFTKGGHQTTFNSGGSSDLVVYVGHDGLMDFTLQSTPKARDGRKRKAIILACVSRKYFAKPLERTGAVPLVWTTGLMAPEAYVLSAAIEGWLKKETDEEVRIRAAKAYDSYQNCGLKAASNLFATGW